MTVNDVRSPQRRWLDALVARLDRGADNNVEGGRRRYCAQTLSGTHAWQRADFTKWRSPAEARAMLPELDRQREWSGIRRWPPPALVSCPCGELPTRTELLRFIEQEHQAAVDLLAVKAQRARLEATYIAEPERGLRRQSWMKSAPSGNRVAKRKRLAPKQVGIKREPTS